jgi:hypothetical protein
MLSIWRLLILPVLLLCAHSAIATTYYISTSGSDSNNGTSNSTPWLHAPGMTGCSANCASKSPAPGDRFILRGGDTWHYNSAAGPVGLPWSNSSSGSSGNLIYWGVDHTWWNSATCGAAAWCRPILNGDNPISTTAVASCQKGAATDSDLMDMQGSWVQVDDFEMLGLCWDQATIPYFTDFYLAMEGANSTVTNVYLHGWTHTASAGSQATGFMGNTDGYVKHYIGVVVDGQDSDPASLCSMCFGVYDVENSVFRYNSNQVGNGGHIIANNLFEYISEPYDSAHGNVMEWNNEAGGGQNYVYNNVVRHNTVAVTLWTCPASNNDYYFNNVMFDNLSEMWDIAESQAGCTTLTGSANFYNNTFVDGSVGPPPGSWLGYFRNTLWVNSGSPNPTPAANVKTLQPTTAQASTYGYAATNSFQPTSSNCNGNSGAANCPVGAGDNLTSLCNNISDTSAKAACLSDGTGGPNYDSVNHRVNGNVRSAATRSTTGNWDVGAFQYGAAPAAPAAPISLKAVAQ